MPGVNNRILHCILSVAICLFSHANGAYFSMSNIHVNLPGDRTKYPPTDHSILTLYALKDNEVSGNKTEHYIYSVQSKEQLVQVFRSTGDVMFKKAFFEKPEVNNITVQASVEDNSGMRDSTIIQINIGPVHPLNCDSVTQDLCFWQSASYRIFENRKPSIIGSLNSPYLAEICKGYKLNYTIIKGGNQFGLVSPSDQNKSWEIRSLKSLDRDVIRSMEPFNKKSSKFGEYRYFSLKCTVKNPMGMKQEVFKNISIKILDEDDNPPMTHLQNGFVRVVLSNNGLFESQVIEHKELIFIDRDSPPVNEYTITITDDSFKIFEPNCTIFEDDREGEPQTAIFCKIVVTKDAQLLESPYSINLEINDTTLIPGYGKNLVKVPIKIYFDKYRDYPRAFALTMPPTDVKRSLLLYPFPEVTIFRTAAPLSRVTQPKKESLQNGSYTFTIRDVPDGVLNITETEGIVFVHNITKLRNATNMTLTIEWINNNIKQSDEIFVKITNEPHHTCNNKGSATTDWEFCSYNKNKKDCNKACGLGTGGSKSVERRKVVNNPERCMWRGDLYPGNESTHLYSTCTPDIDTCPDGICDSLEELHYLICPQDCSESIGFPMFKNPKTGRGFEVGAGICSCHKTGDCYCEFSAGKKKKKVTTTTHPTSTNDTTEMTENTTTAIIVQSNVSRHVGGDLSKCGTKCIMGITGSAVILIVIVGGMIICFRLYRRHKPVREKFSNDGTDLSVPLSDYIDRAPASENFHFDFDLTTVTGSIKRTEPDSKWEFSRSQLSVEQTLGEGEFGRVLRARALNIGGQSGYTTVAVKTLKDDAGERELADLLSEYQLLKEVSHPNVIKLLGASTVPGGPVYLIIEFAEHGSLRNYLRRSRHLQTTMRITTNHVQNIPPEHYDEPKICEITPKEILSFAWQIANGMSYLSDIKLVHRDLAARNVLLATGKICKISDFGLTRDIYEDDAYFKRSKGRVPVKWMAPESLSDHIYTNKSDVWSYGILLWELITLGASPYPGIVVQSLFHLLKTGYRMERPENCSVALYKVMRSCWTLDQEKRPAFADLSIKFEKMLEDEVEYLDLTNNAFNNRGYFCDNLEDVEAEIENGVNKPKSGTEALNYLNKTVDYEKCGESTKIKTINTEPELSPAQEQNNVGYESPIKMQNNVNNLPTPGNEFPQYGYTDMSACQSK